MPVNSSGRELELSLVLRTAAAVLFECYLKSCSRSVILLLLLWIVDHLQHADYFLLVIKDSGLVLTLKKSEYAQPEVKFCGQLVGSDTRRIDHARINLLVNLGGRKLVRKQVRQILGLFGWYTDYIPLIAEIARSSTDLTAKSKPSQME
jgi:hypothetical protein